MQNLSLKIKYLIETTLNKYKIKHKGHEISIYLTEVQTLYISSVLSLVPSICLAIYDVNNNDKINLLSTCYVSDAVLITIH